MEGIRAEADNAGTAQPLLSPSYEGGRRVNVHQRSESSYSRMNTETSLSSWRNWFSFWVLGMINNFAYVVILCGAANLADSFNDGKLTGFVQWANVAIGVMVRLANMYFLESPASMRVFFASAAFLLGYCSLAFSVYFNFWTAIASILFIGGACSFGESLMLGYMKNYPATVTGGWSSGTGMAGVGGSAFYLLMWLLLHDRLGFSCTESLFVIYSSMIPLTFVYLGIFMWGPTRPHGLRGGCVCNDKDQTSDQDVAAAAAYENSEEETSHFNQISESNGSIQASHILQNKLDENFLLDQNDGYGSTTISNTDTDKDLLDQQSSNCTCSDIRRVGGYVANTGVNLMSVYFFEYVISVAFAIHAPSFARNGQWWCGNGYTILQFCYQSGVLLSRSSLYILRIQKVWILTVLQAINFVFWWYNAASHFLPAGLQAVWMFWVGMLGGASYVNIFANIVDDKKIPDRDKELSINIVALYINAGIVLSSLFQILADSTFLSSQDACAAATGVCRKNMTNLTFSEARPSASF